MLALQRRLRLSASAFALLPTFSIALVLGPQSCAAQSPPDAALARARQLIRDTPCPGEDQDALAVVRVVNCLQSLGKEHAISLLREIALEGDRFESVVADPEQSEPERFTYPVQGIDDQRALLIIPLLFDVQHDHLPPPEDFYSKDTRRWRGPAGTQTVSGGIPFRVSGTWTYAGRPPYVRPLVEWASAHGKLRERPFEPQDDPLAAADALCGEIEAGRNPVYSDWWPKCAFDGPRRTQMRDDLRAQAIKMLPQSLQDRRRLSWEERRERVAHTGIHWDRDTQAYVIGDDPEIQRCSCPK